MPYEFRCEACPATLRVPESAAGKRVRCGKCQATFHAPNPPTATSAAQQQTELAAAQVEPPPTIPASIPIPPPTLATIPSEPTQPVTAPAAPVVEAPPPPVSSESPRPVDDIPYATLPTDTAEPVSHESSSPSTDEQRKSDSRSEDAPRRRKPRVSGSTSRSERSPRAERSEPVRNPILKVLVLVGVMTGVVMGGGLYLVWRTVNPSAKWHTHESARGGYKAEFPAPLRDDIAVASGFQQRAAANPQVSDWQIEGTLYRGSNAYMVTWGELPNWRIASSSKEQILNDGISSVRSKFADGDVISGSEITVNGFPAREAVIAASDGTYFVFRLVIAESRFYIIGAGGVAGARAEADIRRFIDSFEVTDATLLAKKKTREDAERLQREESERRAKEQARLAEEQRLRMEEQRKRDEAAAKAREEADRKERERLAELERKRRTEAEVEADIFRNAKVTATAPDPTKLEGLQLYLSFDDVKEKVVPVWPKEQIEAMRNVDTGPGVRGKAIYFSEKFPSLDAPTKMLPNATPAGPVTICGWAKVRKPYGLDLVRTDMDKWAERTKQNTRVGFIRRRINQFDAYSWVPVPYEHRDGYEVFGECPKDEGWHHVTVIRHGNGKRSRVQLYLDGELIITRDMPSASTEMKYLHFGFVTFNEFEVQHLMSKDPDLSLAAADEICVFNRALTAQEVKYLAGKAQSPAPLPGAIQVKLKEHAKIEEVKGVVIDPERNAVWAVSALAGMWKPGQNLPLNAGLFQSEYLLKYSYPDFKLEGKWILPSRESSQTFGSVPVLDRKNNRLYILVSYGSGALTMLQRDNGGWGTYYCFDLDKLPNRGGKLVESARMKDRGSGWTIGEGIVSHDSKWLYFIDPSSSFASDTCVSRVPVDLSKEAESIQVPGSRNWARSLWLSSDGKTLRVIQAGKAGAGRDVNGDSGLLEIDTATWKAGTMRELPGAHWERPNVTTGQCFLPSAVHPDGRAFVGAKDGITETIYAADKVTKRLRPVAVAAGTFMAVSPDGRYLFASEAETKKNRFIVLDARANATELGEIAEIEETDKLRVGGPFFASPDGQFVVFRSGVVLRVDDGSTIARKPQAPQMPKVVMPQAPMPRERVVSVEIPQPPVKPLPVIVSPTDLKGLVYYLDCEEYDGGKLIERVSKKQVGEANRPMLVDGPRGTAIRLTTQQNGVRNQRYGMTLKPMQIAEAGKPFTIALWARREPGKSTRLFSCSSDARNEKTAKEFYIYNKTNAGDLVGFAFREPSNQTTGSIYVIQKDKWNHIALTRDEANEIHLFVNGKKMNLLRQRVFDRELRYSEIALLDGLGENVTLDVDDFCIFDRALTAKEVERLAVAQEQAERPKAEVSVAPAPRELVQSRKPLPAVVSPTNLKGLVYYLDCEEYDGGKLIERVSKKQVGEANNPFLVDGPRGKAIRLTTPVSAAKSHTYGVALKPMQIADAGKPFTIAMWARREPGKLYKGYFRLISASHVRKANEAGFMSIYFNGEGIGFAINEAQRFSASMPAVERNKWVHVALMRDESNELRFYVNGRLVKATERQICTGELQFEDLGLVRSATNSEKFTLDVDDFCIFSRALAVEEVEWLATPQEQAERPKSEVGFAPMPHELGHEPLPVVVSPTDLKGLVYYLDCEGYDGSKLIERVSKNQVGEVNRPMLVDGPRGKAIRLTTQLNEVRNQRYGMTLKPMQIAAAGKPFTVALWARRDVEQQEIFRLLSCHEGHNEKEKRYFTLLTHPGLRESVSFTLSDPSKRTYSNTYGKTEKGKWYHVALIRDVENVIHLFVNGQAIQFPQPKVFAAELRYSEIGLLDASNRDATIDIDDFCIFNRALMAEEVAQLAQLQAKKPKLGEELGIAPMPRQLTQLRNPPPPAATEFKNLRFYLDFDKPETGNLLTEKVSERKLVKLASGYKFIEGRRGKALRVTANSSQRFGVELTPGALTIEEEKPFTFAVWARRLPIQDTYNRFPHIFSGELVPLKDKDRQAQSRLNLSFLPSDAIGFSYSEGSKSSGASTMLNETDEWVHSVVMRNDKNELRFFCDGEEVSPKKSIIYAGALRYRKFGLVVSEIASHTVDIDEFCLFDRALTEDEIKQLAGKEKKK